MNTVIQRVIDEHPIILIGFDEDGKIVQWNRAAERELGYPANSVLGRKNLFSELFGNADLQQMVDVLLSENHDDDLGAMTTVNGASGELRHLKFKIRRRTESIDPGVAVWIVGVDITDEIEMQDQLRLMEERFRMISQATNDAVWDWDLESNELWWGEGISSIFGYPAAGQLTAYEWWESRIHPDDRERVSEKLKESARNGTQMWADTYRFMRKDGSYANVFDRGFTLYAPDGKPLRMIGGMVDETEKQIYLNNLLLRNQQLAEYSFFNSHKVRAPLARLLSCIDLIKLEDHLSEELKELLFNIQTSADELDRMIKEINSVISSDRK